MECGNGFGSGNLLTAPCVNSYPDRPGIIKMSPALLNSRVEILAYTCKVSSSLMACSGIV